MINKKNKNNKLIKAPCLYIFISKQLMRNPKDKNIHEGIFKQKIAMHSYFKIDVI
jgi:hypothetical protein